MQYYKLLKDMPFHASGELLVKAGNFYIFEQGQPFQQYALPVELVEQCEEWFEETFPNWVQNEPCWYITMNGIIVHDYFNRTTHSSYARFGNLFKSKPDAEIAFAKISEIFQPFTDDTSTRSNQE